MYPGYTIVLAAEPDLALGQQAAVAQAANGAPVAAAGGGFFGTNPVTMVIMYVAIVAIAYLLLIRPQRKREKVVREMQAGIQVGDDVVTTGGMFGQVAATDGDKLIVEFGGNKNMRIPVRKTDVFKLESKP